LKIYIMTDMEGVCGVVNHDDWVVPGGRYYEEGKRLLTLEVNAAIEGFAAAGGTEFLVADGHGYGGINHLLLDCRAQYLRGPLPGPYPFMLDASFDAMAWVGQHAKAGTPYAHLAHTGSFHVIDDEINGISVGEFGIIALCGGVFGIRPIFGAGDEAFAAEAQALAAAIETVSVKRGLMPDSGDELSAEAYKAYNGGAIHIHPELARERIREGAERSLRRFAENRDQFTLVTLPPPYRRVVRQRGEDGEGVRKEITEHPDSLIHLLNGVRGKE